MKDAISFRRDWLAKTMIPELTDADQKQYSYQTVVVNLQNLESIYRALSGGDLIRARVLFNQSWQNCMQQSGNLNFAKRFAWEMILSLMQLLAKDGINARDIVMGTDPLSLVSALEKRQELGVTANYLGALYKKERGESFNSELASKRIDQAKQLLITTNKKVYDIATEVGFSDSKYFAVTFRKATELTPSEFRARYYRNPRT